MALFAAISPTENAQLAEAVAREFPGSHFEVAPGQFLIAARQLTTQSVAEKLHAMSGGVGRVLIMNVLNQTGWHSKDMWEWITNQSALISERE